MPAYIDILSLFTYSGPCHDRYWFGTKLIQCYQRLCTALWPASRVNAWKLNVEVEFGSKCNGQLCGQRLDWNNACRLEVCVGSQ
jgi:hypothetical protein